MLSPCKRSLLFFHFFKSKTDIKNSSLQCTTAKEKQLASEASVDKVYRYAYFDAFREIFMRIWGSGMTNK